MQTFLPYPDFHRTAKVLDSKRLFKQVVEARQLLAGLGCTVFKNDGTPYSPNSHPNHPARNMWAGYEDALKLYHNVLLEECLKRGFNTQMQFLSLYNDDIVMPDWMGDREFHASHRSNLKRKSNFYNKYEWSEPDTMEYVWPTKQGEK